MHRAWLNRRGCHLGEAQKEEQTWQTGEEKAWRAGCVGPSKWIKKLDFVLGALGSQWVV